MNPAAYCWFIRLNLRLHPWRALLSAAGIVIATVFVFLLAALRLGVTRELLPRIEAAFPEKEIIVEPKSGDVAFFKLALKNLNDETIGRIEQFEGVARVLPVLPLRIPAMAAASVFGEEFATDVTLYGVPPELLAGDVAHARGFRSAAGEPIPVMISDYFLELYNNGLAEANGLPKLARQSVIGRRFTLSLGESTFALGDGELKSYECIVVGLTRRSGILGGMIPLEDARRLNREHRPGSETYYSQAFVQVRRLADYRRVRQGLIDAQLNVRPDYMGGIRALILAGLGVVLIIAASALFLALLGLFHAFDLILKERRKFIGVTRALGLSRGRLRALILGEALLLGLCGGLLGCAAGHAVALLINAQLRQFVGEIELLPQAIFIPGLSVWIAGLCVAVLGALLTPLGLIRRATHAQPSVLLLGIE